MKIRTHYERTPLPTRQFDWSAYDEDSYDGAEDSGTRHDIGRGPTEESAIAALMEILEDRQ